MKPIFQVTQTEEKVHIQRMLYRGEFPAWGGAGSEFLKILFAKVARRFNGPRRRRRLRPFSRDYIYTRDELAFLKKLALHNGDKDEAMIYVAVLTEFLRAVVRTLKNVVRSTFTMCLPYQDKH